MSTATARATDRYPWIRGVVDHGTVAHQMVPLAELRPLLGERDRLRSYADAAAAAVAGDQEQLVQLLAAVDDVVVDEVLAMAEAVSAACRTDLVRRYELTRTDCCIGHEGPGPCPDNAVADDGDPLGNFTSDDADYGDEH